LAWIAIPFAVLTVLGTFAGGLIALRLAHSLPTVIAFTGGIVVAVALFDVLPEAIDSVGDTTRVTALGGVGFLSFFLFERLLVLHHRDDADQARAHHRVGTAAAAGLSVHSFIDGLGIGLAFNLDVTTGVIVFIAVAAHDFADGLNMVSFVLSQSGDRKAAMRWLRIDAIAPLIGTIVGASLGLSESFLGHLLALYAGFFLYLGATDLLPEAHEHAAWERVALTVAGFAVIFGITRLSGV
jgi:ZIP family zinc transporter